MPAFPALNERAAPGTKEEITMDRMLSLSEVCAAEGVSRWTVQRRIRAGKFPAGIELENGRPGWPESWIQARRENKSRRTLGYEAPAQPEAVT